MSGGNGGGKGFFDNALNLESFSGGGNFFENAFADIVNVGLQSATGGFLGYEDGKISNGVSTNVAKSSGQATVSGLKEVTGAKAAEQANDLARQQYDEAKAGAEKDRADAIVQQGRDEMRKSQMAGAARTTAASRSTNKGTSSLGGSLSLGDNEKDFLGI